MKTSKEEINNIIENLTTNVGLKGNRVELEIGGIKYRLRVKLTKEGLYNARIKKPNLTTTRSVIAIDSVKDFFYKRLLNN